MDKSELMIKTVFLSNGVNWFWNEFRKKLVNPIESQFPNFPLPSKTQAVLDHTEQLKKQMQLWQGPSMSTADTAGELLRGGAARQELFKQIILLFRRERAAYIERLTEKAMDKALAETLEEEVKALDTLTNEEWFQNIKHQRLPRLKDYLPVQYIEAAATDVVLAPREFDEKFHTLQAPDLFLPDLAYFRAKCEDRETPLAVAFLDIDNFKSFNTKYSETKVDRSLLPRFMQTVEAHVFQHGYAYRQGGDEYLILVPSMSRRLSIAFLDELRCKLAELGYPDIEGNTTVSIGLCIVESDCPLTDRELRDRANHAKNFAKKNHKNCIATYDGPRFIEQELKVVAPQNP
jgi:diguanylate cyclase (GGDEF)-like protein